MLLSYINWIACLCYNSLEEALANSLSMGKFIYDCEIYVCMCMMHNLYVHMKMAQTGVTVSCLIDADSIQLAA